LIRQTLKIEEIEEKPDANIARKFATRVEITDGIFGGEKIAVKPGANFVMNDAMRDAITDTTPVAG
jgi:hypothetical protein